MKAPESTHPHDRRQSDTRYSTLKKKYDVLKTVLFYCVILLLLLMVLSQQKISDAAVKNSQLNRNIEQKEKSIVEANGTNDQLKKSLQALVAGRLPGVQVFELGKAVAVEKGKIQRIIFSKIERDGKISYEYLLAAHNDGPVAKYKSLVTVMLFDAVGLQLGQSSASEAYSKFVELEANESRSYNGLIEPARKVQPKYFMVVVESIGKTNALASQIRMSLKIP